LIINPDFQRLFRWEIGQKAKLIERFCLAFQFLRYSYLKGATPRGS
jgi:uncharacterized protein with ParB-like and HNH nuclease domain